MGSMSIMHWAIVAGVVALLFGRGKISGLMEEMAHGIKSFKDGMKDDAVDAPSRMTEPPIVDPKRITAQPESITAAH